MIIGLLAGGEREIEPLPTSAALKHQSMKSMSFLFCVLLIATGREGVQAQVGAAEPHAFARSTQIIVVATSDWNAVEGRLQRYERTTARDVWLPVGEPISVVVGKSGLGWGIGVIATDDPNIRSTSDPVKKEGDGRGPAGVFALGTAFGDATMPVPGSKMPYMSLTESIECVDDPGSKYYNRLVNRSAVAADWNSSEHMRSVGEVYHWGIVVGHNGIVTDVKSNPPRPGSGSCVFLHIWRSPTQGTAGCTAMPQIELETLLTWLDPTLKPLLVQVPAFEYRRLINRWKLPPLVAAGPR
jgi:L,D-peptidoglycan transpeptidase YkuD (ErfK/YbiS/YcfS/YnhG family)